MFFCFVFVWLVGWCFLFVCLLLLLFFLFFFWGGLHCIVIFFMLQQIIFGTALLYKVYFKL